MLNSTESEPNYTGVTNGRPCTHNAGAEEWACLGKHGKLPQTEQDLVTGGSLEPGEDESKRRGFFGFFFFLVFFYACADFHPVCGETPSHTRRAGVDLLE